MVNDTLLNSSFHGGAANVMLWQRVTGFRGHGGLTGMIVIFAVLGTVGFALLRAWQRAQVERVRRAMATPPAASPARPQRASAAAPAATPAAAPAKVAAATVAAAGESASSLKRRRAEILSEVAEVDRRHTHGELGAAEHERQREVLKRELVSVLARLKQFEG